MKKQNRNIKMKQGIGGKTGWKKTRHAHVKGDKVRFDQLLIEFQPGALRQVAPLAEFVADRDSEFLGRAGSGIGAERAKPFGDARRVHDLAHGGIERRDHRAGRGAGSCQAYESRGLVTFESGLVEGRHARQHG